MSRSVAIALGYRPEADLAPQVLAAGSGEIAERIRRIAAEHGIPLEEDSELAERLFELEAGEELPEDLYLIVARIFAYLDHVARRMEAFDAGAGRAATPGVTIPQGTSGAAPTAPSPTAPSPTTRSPAT